MLEKDPREGERSVSVTVFQLNAALRPQRPQGLLGTGSEGRGAKDGLLHFHTAPEL